MIGSHRLKLGAVLCMLLVNGYAQIAAPDVERQDAYYQDWLEKSLPADGELFEGDIEMDPGLRRAVLGYTDKRSAVKKEWRQWPNGIVPFKFDYSLRKLARIRIHQAIKEFLKRTCVRFVNWKGEKDYVVFRSVSHNCSSSVGRHGGKQYITIGRGCTRLGTILHEMMHSLGIIHEQSRGDRDDYVKVLYKNIKPEFLHNFQKYSLDDTTNLGVPYNYASIMHYGNSAFTKNGRDTLQALKNPTLKFGQRIMFSDGDVRQINRLYNCRNEEDEEVYDGLIGNEEEK